MGMVFIVSIHTPWHGRRVRLQRDGHRLPEVVHLVRRHHEALDLAVVQEAEVQGASCRIANFMPLLELMRLI